MAVRSGGKIEGFRPAKRCAKKSVFENMALAPRKAGRREGLESRSAWIISTPLAARATAGALDGLRVMPLTRHSGNFRNELATEDP